LCLPSGGSSWAPGGVVASTRIECMTAPQQIRNGIARHLTSFRLLVKPLVLGGGLGWLSHCAFLYTQRDNL
jgi:hypothetical protein